MNLIKTIGMMSLAIMAYILVIVILVNLFYNYFDIDKKDIVCYYWAVGVSAIFAAAVVFSDQYDKLMKLKNISQIKIMQYGKESSN